MRLGQFASYRLGERDVQGTVQDIEELGIEGEQSPAKIQVRISLPREASEGIQPGTKVCVRLSP